MKTYIAKNGEVERKWWIIDANGQNLGRLSTQIADLLRGKKKPVFTPNTDTGDFVVVINADKVTMTGTKWTDKKYYRHSRYFGGWREFSAKEMIERDPTFLIEDAVKGMLPKNVLSKTLITKLKSYKGAEHPHAAQKPVPFKLNS